MEQAAKNGYPEAMYCTGFMHLNGMGVKKVEAIVKPWLVKPARRAFQQLTLYQALQEKNKCKAVNES